MFNANKTQKCTFICYRKFTTLRNRDLRESCISECKQVVAGKLGRRTTLLLVSSNTCCATTKLLRLVRTTERLKTHHRGNLGNEHWQRKYKQNIENLTKSLRENHRIRPNITSLIVGPYHTRALFEPRNSILSESETCKKTMWRKNSNFRDLAQIEADEAETWHTLRLHVYLSMRQVWASYLSIYFSKFQTNLAAQITVVCRHNLAHSYHCRNNLYSKK